MRDYGDRASESTVSIFSLVCRSLSQSALWKAEGGGGVIAAGAFSYVLLYREFCPHGACSVHRSREFIVF